MPNISLFSLRRGQGLLFLAFVTLLLGSLPVGAWAPSEADELKVVLQGDIKGTNPGVTRDGNTDTVIHHIAESLVAYRSDLSVAPMLAKSIQVSDDMTRFTFTLRGGVKFHNGSVMTSKEVKWSWDRMLDPATRWRCRHWYDGSNVQSSKIEEITTPDPQTIVFQLEKPSSVFLDRMANVQCITAILHPDSVSADGTWIEPIATGPYKFEEWKRGEYVLLTKFDEYSARTEPRDGYAGRREALVPRIRFMVVGEMAIGVASILSGNIDILPLLPLHLVPDFKRRPDVKIQGKNLLSWSVLLMQSNDETLKDVRIRKAIAHAINIDQVAAISTFGNAQANPSAIPLDSPFHTPVHKTWYEYSPAKAKALLKEAGYHGQALTIKTNRKIPYMFENAIAIQAMLTAVGINAPLEVVDWATQLSDFFSGNFQLSAFGYSGRTHPALNYDSFLGLKDDKPNMQWDNHAMLELLQKAEQEPLVERQKQLFEQIHLAMYDEVPIIGLFNEYGADVTRTNIQGYEPWVMGRPRLWGVRKEER
ncbi:ABC transporter substrate-binding protein [Kordiimonas pumila]|uniref:ABC transporter substrate-binding protein n=1 Tax=Kordiimonas pumila TaxID=2161677 RepID=A0ABV7D3Y3_9PROT|nr:ABC transporter substrate-binding protein [Kordiimonas pumila]